MISIHALLAESDVLDEKHDKVTWISIHALLAESDLDSSVALPPHKQFLSTLSLRRATASRAAHSRQPLFLSTLSLRRATTWQAIHNVSRIFLSTLSLRRATVCRLAICTLMIISIHALLAESDWSLINNGPGVIYFYPRSPCGERLLAKTKTRQKVKNFYPRSPCGERLRLFFIVFDLFRFLSTLSLRRATNLDLLGWLRVLISIHALLAESDHDWPPVRDVIQWISIHALLAESD